MSTDTPTPSQALADDVRLLIVLDTQFAARGETELNAEQMARLEAHGWIAEGHENGEYEVTDLGRGIIGRALGEPSGLSGQLTPAGQIVGWRMLGSVTVYMARGASGDMREFVALEDFQAAAAPQPTAAAPREPAQDDRVQHGEWGPMPDAWTEADVPSPPAPPVDALPNRYERDGRGPMFRDGECELVIGYARGWNACLDAIQARRQQGAE